MTIGERIKSQRMALGLTQKEFSKSLGVGRKVIGKWESGVVGAIPLSQIQLMAVLFKVNASYLIEDEE